MIFHSDKYQLEGVVLHASDGLFSFRQLADGCFALGIKTNPDRMEEVEARLMPEEVLQLVDMIQVIRRCHKVQVIPKPRPYTRPCTTRRGLR